MLVKLTLDDGHDGTLLDSRGALETVGIDAAKQLSLQVHVVEGVGGLIVVGLDLTCDGGAVRLACSPLDFQAAGDVRADGEQLSEAVENTYPRGHPQGPCQP